MAIAVGSAAALIGVLTRAGWAVPLAEVALLVAVALLVVLTVGIVLALRRRSSASCACFGASARPLSWRHVLRNAVLLVMGGAAVATTFTVSRPDADPGATGLAVVVGVLVAVVVILLDDLVELFAPAGAAGRVRS